MYKSHYVPQFILKKFGKNIDIYDVKARTIFKGQTSTQNYYIIGLYSCENEILFNTEIETDWNAHISVLSRVGDPQYDVTLNFIRKYLILSYLRTPFLSQFYERSIWNDILKNTIINGINYDYSSEAKKGCPLDLIPILKNGKIAIVKTVENAEPFFINDRGVTIIDSNNAIYPYSMHDALWVSTDDSTPAEPLDSKKVLEINAIILSQIYRKLGMASFDKATKSIQNYRLFHPNDERYSPLGSWADNISDHNSQYTKIAVENTGIGNLIVPKHIIPYLEKLTPDDVKLLVERQDYGTLAELAISERFGILTDSFSAKQQIKEHINSDELKSLTEQYVEHSRSEFDKCTAIILLELCSEFGDGYASDKLYRYYEKGKHTRPDKEQSQYYFQKACEQGYTDSLVVYLKSISSEPDYEQKIRIYINDDCKDGIICATIADIHKKHGDIEQFLKYLERSARSGYAGSVNNWIDYWIEHDPANYEKIEMFNEIIISRSMNSALTLAKFYHDKDPTSQKLISFARDLVKNNNCYGEQICRDYGISLE